MDRKDADFGFLRNAFGRARANPPMVKSTAVSDAGLSKQTIYEAGRENFNRVTYDRAYEALTAVNAEIELFGPRRLGEGGMTGCRCREVYSLDLSPDPQLVLDGAARGFR